MIDTPQTSVPKVTISRPTGTWVVRSSGAVIAESNDVISVSDGDSKPVIFFPQDDVAMAFLDKTDQTLEHKILGTAQYFSIVLAASTLTNAAWAYEAPSEIGADLAGRLAFGSDVLAIEQL